MDKFFSARPPVAKLGVPPKTTANLFASLANRTGHGVSSAPATEHPAVPPVVEPPSPRHEAQIELVRENGAVRRIIVVCQCGERIEMECIY